MISGERIQRYIRRTVWTTAALATARGALQAAIFLIPYFAALALLDRFTDLTSPFRKTMWFLGGAGGLFFFVRGFWPFTLFHLRSRSRELARSTGAFREDDLEIAFDFSARSPEGTSVELKDDFLTNVAGRLESQSAWALFPRTPWKKLALICGALVLLLPVLPLSGRVLFPFVSTRLYDFIEIKPGNAEVAFGSTARVDVAMKINSADKPQLFAREGGDWVEVAPDAESASLFGYDLKNIVQPLSYRVFWRGEWSERFTLQPVKALSIEKFEITVTPPAYLGLEAKTQAAPEISGLAGSAVLLRATLNRDISEASLVLPEGEQIKLSASGAALEGRFTLQRSGVYGFSFSDDRYPLQIRPDEAPTISLLSPAEDLIVSVKDRLPVTYEAADDMGLGEINLIIERERGNFKTRRIHAVSAAQANVLATYEWDLAADGYKPGDVFRFQLEAVDKNTVTGPGRSKSEWRLIEIASFEKSHEALAQILEAWREKTLDLLGDINSTRASLDKDKPEMGKLNEEMAKNMDSSGDVEKTLEKIVSLMEKDPLADYGVWLEHKQMRENMEIMNQTLMRQAQASMQTGNTKEAARALDQVSSELERMLALSEDLSKKQRASDVMEMSQNLEKLGEEMMKQFEDNPQAAAINKMLEEAESILQQMAKSIEQFPKDLPEDFVNQPALKDLNMDQAQDILSQIRDAMKKGDMQKAMALAKQYLDAAKKMSEQLGEAYQSYTDQNSAEQLADEIQERAEKLNEITKKQQELLAQTQKLESERIKQMMEEQGKLLEKLHREQLEAISRAEKILSDDKAHVNVRAVLSSLVTSMRLVAEEFAAKKVSRAPLLLDRVVVELQMADDAIVRSSITAGGFVEMRDVKEREKKILDQLKKPSIPDAAMTPEERETFAQLRASQSSLGKETQTLRKELQALSRKSALLNMGLSEPLSKASAAMDEAAKQLGEGNSKNAQSSEEEALSHLGQAGDALSGAQQQMGAMPGGNQPGGPGGSGPRAIVRQQGGGGKGVQTGKVRLPTVQDYKPPKEFREELLESLKEKYPKVYEEIIHKYYKRLTD